MPLNAHDVSVALFARGLTNLKSLLMKGEAHASTNGVNPTELLQGQLAHDMYNLAVQVHWAADGAKLAVARVVGVTMLPSTDVEKTFAELYERIDDTTAYLAAVKPEDLETGLARTIELTYRGGSKVFRGDQFLLEFAVPNFFFHMTTAYGILRQKGVALTKSDFTGIVLS